MFGIATFNPTINNQTWFDENSLACKHKRDKHSYSFKGREVMPNLNTMQPPVSRIKLSPNQP